MDIIIDLLVRISVIAILCAGLDIVLGMSGRFSIAQGALFGVGAYTSTLAMTELAWPFVPALVAGMVVTAIVSALIVPLTSRVAHFYFAISTLAIQVLIVTFLKNAQSITGGDGGVFGVPSIELFGFEFRGGWLAALSVGVGVLILLLLKWLRRSRFGNVLLAVKADEQLVGSLGYRVNLQVAVAFAVNGALCAVAGAIQASHIQYISPASFGIEVSLGLLIAYMLGGGGVWGAVLGAVAFGGIEQGVLLLPLPGSLAGPVPQVIYGLALVLVMIFFPRGLSGLIRDLSGRRRHGVGIPDEQSPPTPDPVRESRVS